MASNSYSINDLKYFMYSCTLNHHFDPLKTNARKIIEDLINQGKQGEILKEVIDYSTPSGSLNSIDASSFILAVCVAFRKSETSINSAYSALIDISETPLHLFAFIHYHKCILDLIKNERISNGELTEENANKLYGKGWGKGQRKAVTKWYNDHTEEDILRLITKHRRLHTWSHKDVIKIAHIKAASPGIEIIFKYLLFGIENIRKIKISENEKHVFEFLNDYEKLKDLSGNGASAAVLIRKHNYHLEHIPTHLQKYREVWDALIADMTIQQFCSYIGVLTSKRLLRIDTDSYKMALKVLQIPLANTLLLHAAHPLLALLVHTKVNELLQVIEEQSKINQSLYGVFFSYATNSSSSSKRIMCIVDMNQFMIISPAENITVLNAIDAAAAIMLTLKQTEKTVDFHLINENLHQINLPSNTNITEIENILKQYNTFESIKHDAVFDRCLDKKSNYDAFIFLISSIVDETKILNSMQLYRQEANLPNSKIILIHLTGKPKTSSKIPESNLSLSFNGWNMDAHGLLDNYLKDKF